MIYVNDRCVQLIAIVLYLDVHGVSTHSRSRPWPEGAAVMGLIQTVRQKMVAYDQRGVAHRPPSLCLEPTCQNLSWASRWSPSF